VLVWFFDSGGRWRTEGLVVSSVRVHGVAAERVRREFATAGVLVSGTFDSAVRLDVARLVFIE